MVQSGSTPDAHAPGDTQAPMPQTSVHAGNPFYGKHYPEIIGRIMTEVHGAPFVQRVTAGGGGRSRGSAVAAGAEDGAAPSAVDINELLVPAKKKRKAASSKKRAAAKSAAGNGASATQTAAELQEDIALGEEDGAPTRPRCWVDDLIGCLVHSAGGPLAYTYIIHTDTDARTSMQTGDTCTGQKCSASACTACVRTSRTQ